jgi:succinate dehydrogenase / fumarate reductase membrane anchor subunit
MAITTEPRQPGASPPLKSASARGSRPRASFETWSWFFMRISGLVLLFLALIHFAITHILHDVVSTNYDFVQRRWHNLGWRIFDWSLLALALAHGLNGLRLIVDDYVRAPGRRAATKAFLYTLSGVLFAYGTLVIFSFPRS